MGVSRAFDLNDIDFNKAMSGGSKLIKAVAGLSDADEKKIGREVAANLAARYGLVEDAAKIHYVNLVGQNIARQSSRSNIAYRFAILKTSEVNALAAPGGYIFITQGLLDTIQNESELAGVLAHEISHVTQRHIVKAIRKANLVGAGQDLAAAASKDAAKFGQLTDFSINILNNGLSRGDELEADQLGTALAARAGYPANGLRDTIQRLGAKEGKSSTLAHFNKTHPPAAARLQAIDRTIAANHLSSAGPQLADRFRQAFAKS